jgi:hypothetical protein
MKQIYLIVLFLQVCSSCFSQAVTEALHLHLDKDSYLPGETIWFKAYLYNGTNASGISTNLYAALYTAEGKLLQQKQYPIFEGSSNGDFSIPDYVEGNSLQLLVFTKGMRLQDSTRSFYRHITLLHTAAAQANTAVPAADNIQLQFFAEGGTAIAGVSNYYAYRALYANGQPAVIKGSITEAGSNTMIDSFYTNEQGLGSLQFIPLPGKDYKAVWTVDGVSQQITALPQAVLSGAALHTEISGNTLYYVISKNSAGPQNFSISINNSQTTLYTAIVQMNEASKYVGKVPVDSLTPGLIKIALQDDAKKMLEERVVLVNGEESRPVVTQMPGGNAPKTKNTIEIVLPDTLLYNLSASISDINFYDSSSRANIQNSFWLNGTSAVTAGTLQADWLLQAKAYTPYSNTASLQPADNYLTLAVNYNEKNNALPKKERLNLMIKDSVAGNQFYDLQPTTPTSFVKHGLIFYDSAKVFYKTTLTKELENYITLQRDEFGFMPSYINPIKDIVYTNTLPTQQKAATLDSFVNGISSTTKKFNELRTLNTLIVKSKKWGSPETRRLVEIEEKYATSFFRGLARGYQINVLDDERAWGKYDVYSYITNNLPMLTSTGIIGNRKLVDRFRGGPELLLIDEVELPFESLETISVDRLAYIKYIQGIVIGTSFTTSSGVLMVYTKKGDEPVRSHLPQMRFKMIKGYDLPRQFTSPDYTNKENLQQQDRRSTLYWNPYLNTEADKKTIKIEYCNNDISKKLLLVVEGINEEGRLIHIEKVIEN